MQARTLFHALLIGATALASVASAQVADDVATFAGGPALGGSGAQSALSSIVRGPIDVQSGPADNLCLGVACAFGYFWVTGSVDASIGYSPRIHQFDLAGNYLQSFPQVTNSPALGGRDIEWDPQSSRLWTGAENGEVSEYQFIANAGPFGQLVHVAIHQVPGLFSIVRALARDPNTGRFFTADFNGPIYEFDLTAGVVATHPNPGLAVYGASYDFVDQTIWLWSQNATTSPTNRTLASEWNPTTFALTGRTFAGADLTPGLAVNAGGMDIYPDELNPGALTMVALHQGAPDSIVSYSLRPITPPPSSYCTSKTTSLGCVPTITTSQPAVAPQAAGNDYHVVVHDVNSFKSGMIFFGQQGPSSAPFQGGYMCVQPPLLRTPVQNSGGLGVDNCTGVLDILINDPMGLDFAAGATVCFQGWFRDPPSASTTGLSNAISIDVDLPLLSAINHWVADDMPAHPANGVPASEPYRVTNEGDSPVTVERLDEKGKPVPPPSVLPKGSSTDIGVAKGQTLRVTDNDGATNGVAKGTCERNAAGTDLEDWKFEGGSLGVPVNNVLETRTYDITNDGPSRITVGKKEGNTDIGTAIHLAVGSTLQITVTKGQSIEVKDADGPGNGGATGKYKQQVP